MIYKLIRLYICNLLVRRVDEAVDIYGLLNNLVLLKLTIKVLEFVPVVVKALKSGLELSFVEIDHLPTLLYPSALVEGAGSCMFAPLSAPPH